MPPGIGPGHAHLPRAQRRAPRPLARAQEHGVARQHLDTGLLLPRLDVREGDRGPRLEPREALETGHVDQHAARNEPILPDVDAELVAPVVVLDLFPRISVVRLALVEEMAQGIDMAVKGPAVHGLPDELVAVVELLEGGMDVGVGRLYQLMLQRHRPAGLDERRRLLALLGRDEVDGAELVVRPPAAPVGHFLEHPVPRLLGQHGIAADARRLTLRRRPCDEPSGDQKRDPGATGNGSQSHDAPPSDVEPAACFRRSGSAARRTRGRSWPRRRGRAPGRRRHDRPPGAVLRAVATFRYIGPRFRTASSRRMSKDAVGIVESALALRPMAASTLGSL